MQKNHTSSGMTCVCVGVYLVKQVLRSKHRIRLLDYEMVCVSISAGQYLNNHNTMLFSYT